jgi:MATE family multidrug resistance protein
VAVGAGWQVPVAFANIGCYYLVGIPVGVLFGFKLKLGALVSELRNQFRSNGKFKLISMVFDAQEMICSILQGIWMGMLTGTLLQMAILLFIIKGTEWEKQVHGKILKIILNEIYLANFFIILGRM